MICCSPKAIKGLLSQLDISFLFKGLVQWQLLERRRRENASGGHPEPECLQHSDRTACHRHTFSSFFLFVGCAGVLARLRRETCAIDAGASNNNKSPQKGLRGALLYCSP
jgi:hypothetical protein